MKQGIVVIQVDGPDETPLGVVADADAARVFILDRENECCDEGEELTPAEVDTFTQNLLAARSDLSWMSGFDIQFESGFGSWDYRLVKVMVDL
jgi:hypothetical protein